jgi:iron(III) transport system permease protein
MRKPPRILIALGIAAAIAAIIPIGYLLFRLGAGADKALLELVRPRTLELLFNTTLLVVSVTFTALVIGFLQAWLTTRTNLGFGALFAVLATLPLAIPSYVMAFSFTATFPGVFGFLPSWLVMSLATSPYVFLAVSAALVRTDSSSEEVARTLGLSKWQVLRRVTWPQVRPAATASSLLVALYTLSEFGAIAILRFDTFTRAIYNAYRLSFDRTAAAALAVVLVMITLLVIWFERRYRGDYLSVSAASQKRVRISLGKARPLAIVSLVALAILGAGVPLYSLVNWSIFGSSTADLAQILEALWGSVSLAVMAGASITVFALAIALWVVRYKTKLGTFVELSVWANHALPAIVVALALIFVSANLVPWVYQTTALLLFAYLILFLPNALSAMATPIAQVPRSLEDVANSLGVKGNRSIFKVVLPIAAPGILAGAALVALTVLKELPATLLLRPTGTETLAVRLWSSTEELAFAQAAPYALLLVVLGGLPALALNRQARKALSEVSN